MPLKVPYYRQKTDYFCGPAVVQMVLKYYGTTISQERLATILKTNEVSGTNMADLINVVKKKGFSVVKKPKSTLRDVKNFLQSGVPVIVNFIEPSTEEGHYAVVVGVKPTSIILHDPWNGKGTSLKTADFNKRWRKASYKGPRGGKWLLAVKKV